MAQNAAGRGRKSGFLILNMNDSEKWGSVLHAERLTPNAEHGTLK